MRNLKPSKIGIFRIIRIFRKQNKKRANGGAAMDYLALIEDEQQAITKPKRPAFREVEQISLADGMQQIIAGTWQGIGLLDTLPEMRAIWGQQVLIVADGIDRHRLQGAYPGTMIFTPAEFLAVIGDWPESESAVRAKRAFGGVIAGGAA